MARNYAAEMRALIDVMAQGMYAAPIVAKAIIERLEVEDPDLLDGWLRLTAEGAICVAINQRDKATRTANRRNARNNATQEEFQGALQTFQQTGSLVPVISLGRRLATRRETRFLDENYVGHDGTKRPLAKMSHADRMFVADQYKALASGSRLQEAFIRAIDKKAGDKTTGEVFDEEDLAKLWRSICI